MQPPWMIDAKPGDEVFACEYRNNEPEWIKGFLVSWDGEYHYIVDIGAEETRTYHQHELRSAKWCERRCRA